MCEAETIPALNEPVLRLPSRNKCRTN